MSRLFLIFSFFVILFNATLHAQSEKIKGKLFKIKIERTSGAVAEGYLYDCNSSEVLILPTQVWDNTTIFSVPLEKMERIKIRRRGSIGRGIAIGTAVGGVAGYIIGSSQGDDEPNFIWSLSKEDKAGLGTFFGAAAGAGIGTLVGFVGKRFEINQDEQALSSACANMKTRTIRQLHGL